MHPYLVKAETDLTTELEIKKRLSTLRLGLDFKPRNDFHCTLMFADSWKNAPTCKAINVETKMMRIDKFGKAIVLVLEDPNGVLSSRHLELLTEMEAVNQFNEYTPHLTLGFAPVLTDLMKKSIEEAFSDLKISLGMEIGKIFIVRR